MKLKVNYANIINGYGREGIQNANSKIIDTQNTAERNQQIIARNEFCSQINTKKTRLLSKLTLINALKSDYEEHSKSLSHHAIAAGWTITRTIIYTCLCKNFLNNNQIFLALCAYIVALICLSSLSDITPDASRDVVILKVLNNSIKTTSKCFDNEVKEYCSFCNKGFNQDFATQQDENEQQL